MEWYGEESGRGRGRRALKRERSKCEEGERDPINSLSLSFSSTINTHLVGCGAKMPEKGMLKVPFLIYKEDFTSYVSNLT